MHSALNHRRVKEADLLKGFAILSVLLVHTSWNFIKAENLSEIIIFNAVINTFSRFAVPLFIFVSGLVLSYRYSTKFRKETFYSNRIKSILPAYILFSLFYMLCEIAYLSRIPTTKEVIIDWMTGGYGYLWFLVLIMQLYIFFPLLIDIYKKYNHKSEYLLLAAFLVELLWAIVDLGIPKEFLFPSGIFYFMLGIYAYNHKILFDLKFKKLFIIIISIIFTTAFITYRQIIDITSYGGFENIPIKHPISSIAFSIILYALIIILVYNITINLKDRTNFITVIVYSIGAYSFGIFLVHFFYQQLIILLLAKMGIEVNNALFYVILFTGMLILSYVTCYIISRFNCGRYIIGVKSIKTSS